MNPCTSTQEGKKQTLTGSHDCEAQDSPWVMLDLGSPTSLAPPSVGFLFKQLAPEWVTWAHIKLTACRLGGRFTKLCLARSWSFVFSQKLWGKENQLPNWKLGVLNLKKGSRCRSGWAVTPCTLYFTCTKCRWSMEFVFSSFSRPTSILLLGKCKELREMGLNGYFRVGVIPTLG